MNCESMDDITKAYKGESQAFTVEQFIEKGCKIDVTKILDCEQNQAPSDFPIIEMTIPSVLDPTIAPEGKFLDSSVLIDHD